MSASIPLQAAQPPAPLTVYLRVRYAECDAQHVVFNARYGEYADVAMTEFMRHVLGGLDAFVASGMDTQVVRLATDFHAPARFDDVLAIAVHTTRVGNTSFEMQMLMRHYPSDQLLNTTTVTYVLVKPKVHQKMPVPDSLRQQLLLGAPGAVSNLAGLDLG